MHRASAIALAITAVASVAAAQDTRTVTEPQIPAACVTLKAAHTSPLKLEDEAKLDTERLQKAIDGCKGGAVELAAEGSSKAFVSGPIRLKSSVTLLVDKGVTLFASRNPRDYDIQPGMCGINAPKTGCLPLISLKGASNAGIMGDGIIDGRGAAKMILDGKEADKSWWDLGHLAKTTAHQQVPRLIIADHADNFTLYRITLRNSPFFHVTYSNGDGFTAWGVKIDTPSDAPNTDGIDPGGSKNITVTQSYIRTGDDNIAIKGGSEITNMTVSHNHFYSGHGMSIGSETNGGVSKIRVTDLSLDGTTAGIRIKSQQAYGGHVHDVVYEDVCIRNSKNPIQLDTNYSANPKPGKGLIPVFDDITLRNVRVYGGGKIQFNGFDHEHRIGITLDGVVLDDPAKYKFDVRHADLTFGPGPVNFMPAGEDSTARGAGGKGKLAECNDKFVPFPVIK
ncbi:MAG: glycosyl hydrolase family 28 protein [Acidobacteriaceae bacterium]|nr:glycosyl hydrolase family 28 protein [Acidobacteriaceae bacterium]